MGWGFRKQKKQIMSNLAPEQEERIEKVAQEEAQKKAEAYRVIQVVEDPVTGTIAVNCIRNVRMPIEAVGILYKGLTLMEYEFSRIQTQTQKSRIIT